MKKTLFAVVVSMALGSAVFLGTVSAKDKVEKPEIDREFTLVNFQYKGSKVWLPGTMIVKKGEHVRVTLINNAPSGIHGFWIEEYGIKIGVTAGTKKTVEFHAKKKGLFHFKCHLHAAHVGGQIWVVK